MKWVTVGNQFIRTNYGQLLMIKTHGSESQGQEEAGLCDKQVSYLHITPL